MAQNFSLDPTSATVYRVVAQRTFRSKLGFTVQKGARLTATLATYGPECHPELRGTRWEFVEPYTGNDWNMAVPESYLKPGF